jgi:hypothetical protein
MQYAYVADRGIEVRTVQTDVRPPDTNKVFALLFLFVDLALISALWDVSRSSVGLQITQKHFHNRQVEF